MLPRPSQREGDDSMKFSALDVYRCPHTREQLTVKVKIGTKDSMTAGELISPAGHVFPVSGGLVDFASAEQLSPIDSSARDAYDAQAGDIYDNSLEWLWKAFYEDEMQVRSTMLDCLNIGPGQRILEIGCGTGRDSLLIAKRMSGGELYLQDISRKMLEICANNFRNSPAGGPQIEISQSVTHCLPFKDACFDGLFHFGGVNDFREIARVVRPGGKVVIGDESLAPWLRDTEFGRVVINNNRLLEANVPLACLPSSAEAVSLRYIIRNTFYFISFTVGKGPPEADFDLPHKGRRGGTMRTRYYGQLEGVTPEAKTLALQAAKATGKSVHDWLDALVRERAADDLRTRKQ
jgi:SAM-dependent methyltransferase